MLYARISPSKSFKVHCLLLPVFVGSDLVATICGECWFSWFRFCDSDDKVLDLLSDGNVCSAVIVDNVVLLLRITG